MSCQVCGCKFLPQVAGALPSDCDHAPYSIGGAALLFRPPYRKNPYSTFSCVFVNFTACFWCCTVPMKYGIVSPVNRRLFFSQVRLMVEALSGRSGEKNPQKEIGAPPASAIRPYVTCVCQVSLGCRNNGAAVWQRRRTKRPRSTRPGAPGGSVQTC